MVLDIYKQIRNIRAFFLVTTRIKTADSEAQSPSSLERRQIFLQFAFALIANVANISPGMALGFSAVALPQLQHENATFRIDETQASWTASLGSLSIPVGCLLVGYLLHQFGRKAALLLVNVPCILGWLLIAFADGESTLDMIYAGRFFTGLSNGMGNAATVYSAEMATDSFRGMFITWICIVVSLGIFLVYVLGYILQENLRLIAGISAIFPAVAFVLTFFFLPETPSWLLSNGKTEEAEKSLKKIRGVPKSEQMPQSVQTEFKNLTDKYVKKPGDDTPKKNIRHLIFKPETIKPFIIMNLFFFFQQFSGIYVVIFYAVNIAKDAGVTWDPHLVTILIGLTRLLLTIIMSFVSKRCGKRTPAIVSGSGMTLSMGALAMFLYLKTTGAISEDTAQSLSWLPSICLIMHIATSTIGFLILPWAMAGEVFPLETRGPAAGLTYCIGNVLNFITIKLYLDMLQALSNYGVFFFYGVISALGTVFIILFLPETEGKSLQEIEELFGKKKKTSSDISKL